MRATLANSERQLAPGLFARVQIAGGAPQQQILITDRAIGTDQDRKFVYVVDKDGKAEYRAVKLGPVNEGLRIVREGLKPGEKIVVNGLQRVRPGAPVTAQTVPMVATTGAPASAPATAPAKDVKVAMADKE
jgi:multidrug efflux system membrane fusion protein